MTRALYDRIDAIESFAADVAHEIKNPLTSLRSAVETAARIEDPVKQRRLLAIILEGNDSHPTGSCTCEHRRWRRCGDVACFVGVSAAMIAPPANTQIWIAAGVTDLRRGFTGLSALVQTKLEQTPFSGHVFVFRGRRGDLIKVLWFDGDGLCLFSKRLERGRFVWPQASSGTVALTRAQLSMLLEGIDWRRPERTWDPQLSV